MFFKLIFLLSVLVAFAEYSVSAEYTAETSFDRTLNSRLTLL
jgi:hypothetical protein